MPFCRQAKHCWLTEKQLVIWIQAAILLTMPQQTIFDVDCLKTDVLRPDSRSLHPNSSIEECVMLKPCASFIHGVCLTPHSRASSKASTPDLWAIPEAWIHIQKKKRFYRLRSKLSVRRQKSVLSFCSRVFAKLSTAGNATAAKISQFRPTTAIARLNFSTLYFM